MEYVDILTAVLNLAIAVVGIVSFKKTQLMSRDLGTIS